MKATESNSSLGPTSSFSSDLILDTITDGFFVLDKEWVIRHCNKAAKEICNYKGENLIGKKLWTIWPPTFESAFHQQYKKAFTTQKALRFEEYYAPTDAWFEICAYPHHNNLLIYFRNVTERKQAEKKLKELNESYNYVFKATLDAVWEWELDNDFVVRHGDNFKKEFGYDIADGIFPTAMWYDVIHKDDIERVMKKFKDTIADPTANNWTDHYRYKKTDGTYAYVLDTAYIIRNADGTAVKMLGALRDVTFQEEAKQLLIESKNQYESLFDASPVPKWIYDRRTLKILGVNKTATEHYGYTREEFLTLHILDLHQKKDREKVLNAITEKINKRGSFTSHWTHKKKNGQLIEMELHSTDIFYNGMKATLVEANDITEKRKLQDELIIQNVAKQKEITKAIINTQEKERSELAKELHDNVNQILTTTKLYLEMALSDEKSRVSLIQKSFENSVRVIDEIRSLCKSLTSPTLADVGLIESIEELIENYNIVRPFHIHFKASKISNNISEEIKFTLFRIVQEQLNNIIKYAQAKNVWLTLEQTKTSVALIIKDDGVGFDTKARRKGVGITNILNRVSVYHGQAIIISNPSHGCTIEVTIPLQKSLVRKLKSIASVS
ncbi:MAG: PAS domain S-box protein [Chitinophagaceae bacterium]|nr:PAS domain S-box protein [Chitinophagaceae bacterium]